MISLGDIIITHCLICFGFQHPFFYGTWTGFIFFKDNGGLGVKFCFMWERSGVGFAPNLLCSVWPKLVKKFFKVSAISHLFGLLWSIIVLQNNACIVFTFTWINVRFHRSPEFSLTRTESLKMTLQCLSSHANHFIPELLVLFPVLGI